MKLALRLLSTAVALTLAACSSPAAAPGGSDAPIDYVDMEEITVPEDFDFGTTQKITFRATTEAPDGSFIPFTPVDIFYGHDFSEVPGSDGTKVMTALTSAAGTLEVELTLPSHVKTLYVRLNTLGIPSSQEIPVWEGSAYAHFGPAVRRSTGARLAPRLGTSALGIRYLGEFDSDGLPAYLSSARPPSMDLLAALNASLPEGQPVSSHHSQYLGSGDISKPDLLNNVERNLVLNDPSEVFVTFLHEGSGQQNALAYFTYPRNDIPKSPDDIEALTVMFPNASFSGSGGNLISGDTVQLVYHGPDGDTTLFPENTVVAWALLPAGFGGDAVTDTNGVFYADRDLNPEKHVLKRIHSVLLSKPGDDSLIVGFEESNRQSSDSDHDFNDAIIMVHTTTPNAADLSEVAVVDEASPDSDGDNVSDLYDAYPNDPDLAFESYSPGADSFSTLAFEDLWPTKGDYDFNDVVVDYRFKAVTNAQNEVVRLESTWVMQAVGAAFVNALAFELPVSAEQVAGVSGSYFVDPQGSWNYIKLNDNGTEAGQTKAVIFVTDDTAKTLGHIVNTVPDGATEAPAQIDLVVDFTTPVALETLGSAPYNPFIIPNVDSISLQAGSERAQRRGYEVHLPNHPPTELADTSLFGTSDDTSVEGGRRSYVSASGMPWALNIVGGLDWPQENMELSWGYYNFGDWVESGGKYSTDWHLKKAGYRNEKVLYNKAKLPAPVPAQ